MKKDVLLEPVSPGEILSEEFMIPLGISQNRLARDLRVPPGRINELVKGKRRITADTALRLSAYFGTTPQFWMNLQNRYDLEIASRYSAGKIKREVIAFREQNAIQGQNA
jgi:addiction module HigA family antidote